MSKRKRSQHPLAAVVRGWNKMNTGQRAAFSRGMNEHRRMRAALPPDDPRRIEDERRFRMVERAVMDERMGLKPGHRFRYMVDGSD
jgi:hypothetical protein